MTTSNPAVEAAMQIILKAGDGRTQTFNAIKAIEQGDFETANAALRSAHENLRAAHRLHTQIIQSEASGDANTFSALFTHAQDTLMTANSEYRLIKKMTPIFDGFEQRLRKLEEGR